MTTTETSHANLGAATAKAPAAVRPSPAQLGLLAPLAFVLFLTFAAFLARWTQPFEIFSHFRMHLAAAALALALALLALRQARAALAAFVAAAANVAAIAWALAAPAPAAEANAPAVRVLWANLQRKQEALDAAVALARAVRADIVAMTELPPGRADAVRRALPDFLCIVADSRSTSPSAVLIASRRPCAGGGAAPTTFRPAAAQFADIGELRVVALHARPPWSNERTAQRNAVIMAGARAAAAHPRSLVIGDFNATPWSPIMIDVGRGHLRRAPCGGPWAVTWGGNMPFHRLVIDHALLGRGLAVADCRLGDDIGSDHRPLIVDVSILH